MATHMLWLRGRNCFGKLSTCTNNCTLKTSNSNIIYVDLCGLCKKGLCLIFFLSNCSGKCYRSKIDETSTISLESPTSLSDILAPSTSSSHQQQQKQQQQQQSQKTLPHSIRLVEIPWSKENKASLQFSIDDSQSGTMSPIATKHNGVRISQ